MIELKEVRLGEICELKYGKALKKDDRRGGNVPVYGSGGIVGYHDEVLTSHPTLIIGRKGSIGEVYYEPNASWTIDTAYYVEFSPEEIDIKWFEKLLKSLNLQRLNKSAAIPGLNRRDFYSLKVLIPSKKEDQIRIAKVLGKVEEPIKKREESIALANEFLKMKFLEMFGDPTVNDMEWEKNPVNQYSRSIVPGRDKPKSFTGDIPWITTNDIKHLGITSLSKGNLGLTKEEIQQVRAKVIPSGSVIMTCVGDLGIVSINKMDCVINQQLHSFQCKDEMNEVFLCYVLSFQKNYMYKHASTTTVAYMNKKVCNSIPVIKPPIELQNQFASIVQQTEKLKAHYQQSLDELNNLYGSLSQLAFKGELDVSGVEAEPEVMELQASIDFSPNVSGRILEPDRQKLPKAEIIPEKERFLATSKHLKYLILKEDFESKHFTFEEIKKVVNELEWEYDFETLKELVFDLVRKKQLKQVFVDAFYRSENKEVNESLKDELNSLEEKIYYSKSTE